MRRQAHISDCGLYRYRLWRHIDQSLIEPPKGTCTFVMLNPSTADGETDDPTVRRCRAFARDWGYETLCIVNLYAYRATDPAELWKISDPVGPLNDHILGLAFGSADLLIAAWGVNAKPDRVAEILSLPHPPRLCLGHTKDGHPRHPLYLNAGATPRPL